MAGLHYTEVSKIGVTHGIECKEIFYHGKTKFQEVTVLDSIAYGKCLFMDGQIQSAASDEYIYHESLVHPVMLAHPNPKRVFIGGGGEGATAREVLRHKSVEELVMVDIDDELIPVVKEHMKQWHAGCFDDPRMKFVADDARKILLSYPSGYFDVIILDLCDPLDFGPCYTLYSTEFYNECYDRLSKDGVFVTQSACANPDKMAEVFTPVINTLKASPFAHVYPYAQFVPSFIDLWGFSLACKSSDDAKGMDVSTLANVDAKTLDDAIASRLDVTQLQHYDGEAHRRMFAMPKWARSSFAAEKRVICQDTPIYVAHIKAGDKTQE